MNAETLKIEGHPLEKHLLPRRKRRMRKNRIKKYVEKYRELLRFAENEAHVI